jgi:hypothetical protein
MFHILASQSYEGTLPRAVTKCPGWVVNLNVPSYGNESLNANANVRNMFFKNIYTPGVFDLEKEGGVFGWREGGRCGEIFGRVD